MLYKNEKDLMFKDISIGTDFVFPSEVDDKYMIARESKIPVYRKISDTEYTAISLLAGKKFARWKGKCHLRALVRKET